MQIDFTGQAILITGGAGGIGRASAEAFLASGARRVVLLDAARVPLLAAVEELGKTYPGRVLGEVVDLVDLADMREVVRRVFATDGPMDVLLNSARVNRRQLALDVTPEDWDYVLGVNLRGLFFATQEVGRAMVEQRRGAIVNVASVSSVRGHRHLAAYAASKGGIAQLTRVLAHEWAPFQVRVNAVAPGYVETGLTRTYLEDAEIRAAILAKIPLGRIGSPGDVVGAVLFLASGLAEYVTGEILFVDGGRMVD